MILHILAVHHITIPHMILVLPLCAELLLLQPAGLRGQVVHNPWL